MHKHCQSHTPPSRARRVSAAGTIVPSLSPPTKKPPPCNGRRSPVRPLTTRTHGGPAVHHRYQRPPKGASPPFPRIRGRDVRRAGSGARAEVWCGGGAVPQGRRRRRRRARSSSRRPCARAPATTSPSSSSASSGPEPGLTSPSRAGWA
jgi:hypothetical protein